MEYSLILYYNAGKACFLIIDFRNEIKEDNSITVSMFFYVLFMDPLWQKE